MKALLIVDLQNDFLPGGALAISNGNQIIPIINQLLEKFSCVVASKDWHPPGHVSFASRYGKQVGEVIYTEKGKQVLWPDHCIQNTPGAEFSSQLNTKKIQKVFLKGVDPEIDSYSAFYDNVHLRSTGLEAYLRSLHVDEIVIVGLATEYCVKYSALDAIELGFKTYVATDACMGIHLQSEDVNLAIKQMESAGIHIQSSSNIKSNAV
jgi:nicotinamidase/pyrazinamidase